MMACTSHGALVTTAITTSPSPATSAGLHVRLAPIEGTFAEGYAEIDGPYLRIVVADRAIACGAVPRSDHADLDALGFAFLELEVPLGPGDGRYGGEPVGTFAWLHSAQVSAEAQPHLATLTLDALPKAKDQPVVGQLMVDARQPKSAGKMVPNPPARFLVSGSFSVPLCTSLPTPSTTGLDRPTKPMSATLVGMEQFVPHSALAWVERDEANDVDVLSAIELFDEPVDCAGLDSALGTKDSLSLRGFGASSRVGPTGRPIPASASFHFQRPKAKRPHPTWLTAPPEVLGAEGWLTFDAISFVAGGHVTGVARAGNDALAAEGRFDAVVCRK